MKPTPGFQNRTGAYHAPELLAEMMEGTAEFPPSSAGDATAIAEIRMDYARDADPLGTMPEPPNLGGLAKAELKALTGARPALLLDKLGERLAFERAGTRLYDALISKHDAGRTFRGGPSRDDLQHVRDEEQEHFLLLRNAVERLGGDPTAVTPSADLQATASSGLPAVLADPRTDLLQCLEAILVAELVDNDCWPALMELAANAGETELVRTFEKALEHEREHLTKVRIWVAVGTSRSPNGVRAVGMVPSESRRPVKASKRATGEARTTAGAKTRRRNTGSAAGSARKKRPRRRIV